MISFKGRHHQQDIILQCVRWYVAYSLSYRDLEELMQERGYAVDHSTIQRWVVQYAPRIEKAFRKNKKRVGHRWRMDETYIKIKGEWNCNAFAERFVRSIKEECLDRLILFGEASLRRALREYVAHYHTERNHQGVGNELLESLTMVSPSEEPLQRRERLGGVLNFYHREAA